MNDGWSDYKRTKVIFLALSKTFSIRTNMVHYFAIWKAP